MTAYCAVARGGELKDRAVFVSGGAGAVGHYAVQWAKRFGARVVATVSSGEKATHARAAGADIELRRRARNDIVRWLKEGGMKHTASAVFPLARTADAHQAVEAGGKRGTVVVECSS